MSAAVAHHQALPVLTSFDPAFDPSLLNLTHASPTPLGSRYEVVPHDGPGTAVYVRQPTRAQLKANAGLFGSPNRPFYYKDPLNKPFIDADGQPCGPRWVLVDPRGSPNPSAEYKKQAGCVVM